MKIRFWGVRGSLPTPITSRQLQGKISAIIQRIKPENLESPESREAFLAELPPYLFSTIGGNTTCLEVRLDDDTIVVFDAGTGIRELASAMKKKNEHIRHYHIFFTHFHWDHLQGLPFFSPAANPQCSITFYSPVAGFETYIRDQMKSPYFPVELDQFQSTMKFVVLDKQPVQLGTARIYWKKRNHPGGSYAYCIKETGASMIFSTDTELIEDDFKKTEENVFFFEKTDVLVLDAQYTLGEAIEKYNWGHSSYSLAVDFAAAWDVKELVLFHHEPMYDDQRIYSVLQSAKWYLKHLDKPKLSIRLAVEGAEISVP